MPSSGKAENNRGKGRVLSLHRLLHYALKLGCKNRESAEKWHCPDFKIQLLVILSIDAFLECISSDILQHPLVKDSVDAMTEALESILKSKNQRLMRLACDVSTKMANVLRGSDLQSKVLDLIGPLVELLSTQELQVAMSCATALNSILSQLLFTKDNEGLPILKKTKAVSFLVCNITTFRVDDKPIKLFLEVASSLSKILWLWPPLRFCVYNDSKFLNALDSAKHTSESSAKLVVLQLYYALALCCNGADKILESGEALLTMVVDCMDCSNSLGVRLWAFRLARSLALSRRGCIKMMNIYSEPLVKAVIMELKNWKLQSEKLTESEMDVVKEACRLASVTRWAGDHHQYFWKEGVDRVLLDLLLDNYDEIHQMLLESSVNDLAIKVRQGLSANFKLSLRPYVWDILGGLAANCSGNFNCEMHKNKFQLKVLVICVCLVFINSTEIPRRTSQISHPNAIHGESAARAVIMMVCSASKYIASMARSILFELFPSRRKVYLENLLKTLKLRCSSEVAIPSNLQIVVSLMSLACYSSLPKFQRLIIKCEGVQTLIAFIRWWLKDPVRVKRASLVPHLLDGFTTQICCFHCAEEWGGDDMFLLFSLRVLAELVHHSALKKTYQFDDQIVQELKELCSSSMFSPGSRLYAAYILCFFGVYGFPSKMGQRIGKALGENKNADLRLDLVNQEAVCAHKVILMFRCPLLLPPVDRQSLLQGEVVNSVQLSVNVNRQLLLKLLEFVYLGYLHANDDLANHLIIFSKCCKQGDHLLKMLHREAPNLETPIPRFDLSPALEPTNHHFSYSLCLIRCYNEYIFSFAVIRDLLVEAITTELVHWRCNFCFASVPHLHVHRVVLESSSAYLQVLFGSGMQESNSHTIKVPVSWNSLKKLVSWLYSDQLPAPNFGCVWDNLDPEEKLEEIRPYLELCWLADSWQIEYLYEECRKILVFCLQFSTNLPANVIQVVADLPEWNLVRVEVGHLAPLSHLLKTSGWLASSDWLA
ncbi:BTB/POZ domain-containing protein At1g04390-like [Henckelia pumila]|uniref:BTB/POZ domain-containing protein At1g04390-like n=1 Tax=Henckelia pumila TaxID=405737 RepID=UPI003C6DC938